MEDPVKHQKRLENMLRIRRFEEQVVRLSKAGGFPGHYHVYIGQEATAVTVCEQLEPHDMIFTTWRNHGHLLARGASPGRMLAEILGRATGLCRGKSGTLHLADKEIGMPATSAMVGGALPIATGAALGLKHRRSPGIVVAFFGDAALDEGAFYEAVNLAGLWKVPILYVCENNSIPPQKRRRGQFPSSSLNAAQLIDVPRALQIPSEVVDGADVDALCGCFRKLIAEVRTSASARFVEVRCTRWPGNVPLWPELPGGEWNLEWAFGAKPEPQDLAAWAEKSDPLLNYLRGLLEAGTLDRDIAFAVDARVRNEIADAVHFAESSPWPDPAEATRGTFAAERRT
ncbi:MAG: thiamine pyrophosphate-dependent dehydrogenase E1 component subunit alpha [Deltaproteobacteria bacterium]|nr:thiamine pyrophosphate-dependent dehydrogenase E1 component subunit alpha [Deltaproteobacteria bacterium]